MCIVYIIAVSFVIISFVIMATRKGDSDMTQIECLIVCV